MPAEEKGFALWFTGLPSSGKSTLAGMIAEKLRRKHINVQVLDSDELRNILTPEPDYSEEERNWFYEVMVFFAGILTGRGVNVIMAATAHKRKYRERARRRIDRFAEIYVKCSLQTCMSRDDKGIYEKASKDETMPVPGLRVPYEEPVRPELITDTDRNGAGECIGVIERKLKELGFTN